MASYDRNELARLLAQYDQDVALTTQVAGDPDDGGRETAQAFLPVLEEWRQDIEAALRECDT